ncbi:MAG TPA: hypothetical protein VGD45_09650 [Steroidobacter sp.]|uniref:hypothetical protein n=1 Tax=Steroidobacter sp. TaxID=1978227 RepID=UPI002EDACDD4
MFTALLILVLLVLAASLGSWLFNQWLSEQRRASALSLGIGGMGLVLLLGASAVAIVSTSATWQAWIPGFERALPDSSTKGAPVAVADLGTADQWPATTCIKPLRVTSTVPRRWFLDNECERPIVVMLAWCDAARSECTAGARDARWQYEAAGLVLTSALARPTPRRMPEHEAPITGTYALAEPQEGALRIRYLACYLAEPAIAAITHDTMSSEEFQSTLRADACYSRVASASQAAARSGQPPVVSFH